MIPVAKIVDQNTRIIDVDFGTLQATVGRELDSPFPTAVNLLKNGTADLLQNIPGGQNGGGSYIQYKRVDLSFMLKNGELMMPVNVNSQRTSPVPLGSNNNGATFNQVEEYIYILTRPLNNEDLLTARLDFEYQMLRNMGLDGCDKLGVNVVGDSGLPNFAQCIYAEKRIYGTNTALMATRSNGSLDPTNSSYNTMEGQMVLNSVSTWGSMSPITGPNLHCYRIVLDYGQTMPDLPEIVNRGFIGSAVRIWPPVNVSFLCKDPNYTDGEYITRIANAMSANPEGGPVA